MAASPHRMPGRPDFTTRATWPMLAWTNQQLEKSWNRDTHLPDGTGLTVMHVAGRNGPVAHLAEPRRRASRTAALRPAQLLSPRRWQMQVDLTGPGALDPYFPEAKPQRRERIAVARVGSPNLV